MTARSPSPVAPRLLTKAVRNVIRLGCVLAIIGPGVAGYGYAKHEQWLPAIHCDIEMLTTMLFYFYCEWTWQTEVIA